MTLRSKRTVTAYGFLVLPLIFFLGIRIFPTLEALSLSVQTQKGALTGANYQSLFSDPVFWRAILNSLLYLVITVPFQIAIGLLLAVAIERVRHLKWFYRIIYFLPYITSIVAVSWVWRLMYDPNFGLFNEILGLVGIPPQNFLSDPKEALACVSVVMIWQMMGFSMLIFSAGLQAIPRQLYAAARIDGAGSWKIFWRITLPLLNPTLVFLAVTGGIQAMQTFTQVENLTGSSGSAAGGPLHRTTSMVVYMYNNGFIQFNMQYASAVAVVLFVIIMLITLAQLRTITRNVDY